MAISKPSWLRTFLDKLNWDILTWKVYVGDAVESGIDWVIEKTNQLLDLAEGAWAQAVKAWDRAVEVGKQAWQDLMKEADKLWAKIDTWWDDLGEWWTAKRRDIKDWIAAAKEGLLDLYNDLNLALGKLRSTWDNFWTSAWPQLLKDFNTLLVNVGNFFTQTLPRLAEKLDITRAFDNFRLEWKDLFNFWGEFKVELGKLLTDPEEWLLKRIENMLARFW